MTKIKRSREGRKSIFPLAIIGVIGILVVILMLNRNPFARQSYTLLEPTGIIGEKSSSSSVASSSVAAANHHSEKMSVSVAYQHSFGLFDDITDLMWQRMQKKTKAYSWYRNPLTPLEKVEDAEWWNSHNMLPHFQCPHAERIGGSSKKHLNEYEGTKLVCNPQRLLHPPEKPTCLIYSVGCAGDFKFEDAMAELHNGACEIHVFDPADWTKRAGNQRKLNNIHFHAWGLKSSYDQESKSVVWPRGRGGGFKTFQETLELLGHQNRIIDIFKIDCEGCVSTVDFPWTMDVPLIYSEFGLLTICASPPSLCHFRNGRRIKTGLASVRTNRKSGAMADDKNYPNRIRSELTFFSLLELFTKAFDRF